MPLSIKLVVFVCVSLLICTPLALAQDRLANSYSLPGDGIRNNNQYIGPFCCTGETIRVTMRDGLPLGYVYFFNWRGPSYNLRGSGIAPDIEILVAGIRRISMAMARGLQREESNRRELHLYLEKGALRFSGQELRVGVTKRIRVGQLNFQVSIRDITTTEFNGGHYFFIGSLRVKLRVTANLPSRPTTSAMRSPLRDRVIPGPLLNQYRFGDYDWQSCQRACEQKQRCVGWNFGPMPLPPGVRFNCGIKSSIIDYPRYQRDVVGGFSSRYRGRFRR